MKYVGSKNRHAKELLDIILRERETDQWYVEPFVGGCNMIDKVTGPRMGNDAHFYLIELFKAIQNGWEPPLSISEKEYYDIKSGESIEHWFAPLAGFVGFGCSYSGKWWGGYARGGFNKDDSPRNYCLESRKNILKQAPKLKDVIFSHGSYKDLVFPNNSVVYCDPPYQHTVEYKTGSFDHKEFWDWVREISQRNKVFVSEYNAPDDFECLWQKETNNRIRTTQEIETSKCVEKLFRLKYEHN